MRKSNKITISLLPELVEKVNRIAKEEKRSRSDLMREALRCYLRDRERERAFRRLDGIWEKTQNDDPAWIENEVNEAVKAARQA